MIQKLAIIHTSPFTVEPLKILARRFFPNCEVINLLDDSILPDLGRNGGDIAEVIPRWKQYATIAEGLGAQCVINACSSVGQVSEMVQQYIAVPIFRIDEAMAEHAVNTASSIGIAATLQTTLNPTRQLIERKAEQKNKKIVVLPQLAEQAYKKLMAGDQDGHDTELRIVLKELARKTEIVVLAQASMARVVQTFPEEERMKFVTSPETGMARIRQMMDKIQTEKG